MKHIILSLSITAAAFPAFAQKRAIKSVQPVNVACPQGTAPRLPYRLWVGYSDGKSEWRQVRWDNAALATEQSQAQAAVGASYTVQGHITGDPSTTRGYAVEANVKVVPAQYHLPAVVARPLPLGDVHLTGDNLLTHNRDLDTREILSWSVEQQLYNYRDTYGLPTDGYPVSDGWDSPVTKLKGHGTGHYLSALALAYASNTDESLRQELRSRMKRMVDEMRACQERTFVYDESKGRYFEARDFAPEEELRQMQGSWADFDRYKQDYRHYGYGYLNAIPAHHAVMVEMYRPYNNEQWVWAPYYTIHKQLAGLIDIATLVDDQAIARKALQIATDMGMWVWNRMHYRTFLSSDGTRDERRARPGNRYEMWNTYIAGENGGMGESMARLAMMVSDKDMSEKLLEGARAFDNPVFFDALSKNIDDIRNRHANQHIPQIVGALKMADAEPSPYYYNLSLNFWQLVQGRYRYATGGVGNGEMFRLPYTQMLSMVTNGVSALDTVPNPTLNETCCAYNLAKLTKDLNCFDPNNAALMDYYERVLYNQIVGSLNPERYATTYHYAVGLNADKPWGNRTPQESCCGGTGSENHVKYQEAAYFVGGDTLWVALYMPTEAVWREKGVQWRQECSWPAQYSDIVIDKGGAFAMKLRVPYWATSGFSVKVNGKKVKQAKSLPTSRYVEIPCRQWAKGDVVHIEMPFNIHLDFAPDKIVNQRADSGGLLDPAWAGAVMYGPLVMTGTGVATWQQATMNIDTQLEGMPAELLMPDYARHEGTTHYYRIQYTDVVAAAAEADMSRLEEAVKTATSRMAEQQAWQQHKTGSAPWAPYGYARMMEQAEQAQALMRQESPRGGDVERLAAALEASVVSMRPGNLAEPEDLKPLAELMRRAEEAPHSEAISKALGNARMVNRYVADGSGTHDMIDKAVKQLEEAIRL